MNFKKENEKAEIKFQKQNQKHWLKERIKYFKEILARTDPKSGSAMMYKQFIKDLKLELKALK